MGMELLWRRRSHVSMFTAGGICFLLLGKIRQLKLPAMAKPLAGAAAAAQAAFSPAGNRRKRRCHSGRTGHRTACKPQLSYLGLPPGAAEFYGADLPALQPAVDPGMPAGHGAL